MNSRGGLLGLGRVWNRRRLTRHTYVVRLCLLLSFHRDKILQEIMTWLWWKIWHKYFSFYVSALGTISPNVPNMRKPFYFCKTKISASGFNQHHVAGIVEKPELFASWVVTNILNTHNLVWKSFLWLKHYRVPICLHTHIYMTDLKSQITTTIIFSDPIISEWSSSRQDEARHCPSLSQDCQHGQHVSGTCLEERMF